MRCLSGLLLLLALIPGPLCAAMIEGRVIFGEAPLAGMRVEAHGSLDLSGEPAAVSSPTTEDGRYRLVLPRGTYALVARDKERGLFAFCGRNPVTIEEGTEWAGLLAVKAEPADYLPYDSEFSGAVEGTILYEGRPLEGAHVYLYLDVAEDLKGQGYRLSPPTGPDGAFAFDDLPESGYFLVARKRQSGERVGPVLEGDFLALYPGNPLTVRAGRSVRVTLNAVRKVKEATAAETLDRAGGMTVRGKVTDRKGEPVAGVHVFAYTDRVIGHHRPASLSPPTGADGRFTVHFRKPGTYYLGARERYGDSPAPGELFGLYDETADHGLTVRPAETVEGVHIVVEPMTLE